MKSPFILAILASAALAQSPDWTRLAGDQSRMERPLAVVVSDDKGWAELWRQHAGDAPAPAVDFSRERVVAVFLGVRDRLGYKVEFEADRSDPAVTVVTYGVKKPSGFGATMVTAPFVFEKVAAPAVKLVAKGKDAPVPTTKKAEAPAATRPADLAGVNAALARMPDLRDAVAAASAFDGSALRLAQALPPPPGGGAGQDTTRRGGKPLPPPPGGGTQEPRQGGGKPLPPPPGSGQDEGGKPLPPPPGGGKPLPPPPGVSIPRPTYPGGPLPRNDHRLEAAERTYTTYGKDYIGYWYAGTSFERARGVVRVTPADAGKTFVLTLESPKVQEYVLFYRDPQTNEYSWAPDTERIRGGTRRKLEVDFGWRTLLPWEKESFTFVLEGRSLSLESQDGAFDYTLTTTSDPRDPEYVKVTLNPGRKRLTAPDGDGVAASLVNDGGTLRLVVDDKWAAEYQGETLEVAFVVRKDDGSFWRRDPVVASADSKNPFRVNSARATWDIGGGSGKYYLESWSFRRAGSKLSSGGWVGKGKGNTITK